MEDVLKDFLKKPFEEFLEKPLEERIIGEILEGLLR